MRSSVREFLASEALHHLGVSLDSGNKGNTFEQPESTNMHESHEIQRHMWKHNGNIIKTTSKQRRTSNHFSALGLISMLKPLQLCILRPSTRALSLVATGEQILRQESRAPEPGAVVAQQMWRMGG